jgi:hypothetical protein
MRRLLRNRHPTQARSRRCSWQLFFLQRHLSSIIGSDPRNGGITATTHYELYIVPSSLVFDLRNISGQTSMLDESRVLLLFAASRKDSEYERVTLSFRGEPKFFMKGEYFRMSHC